jgi:hypothetical protein
MLNLAAMLFISLAPLPAAQSSPSWGAAFGSGIQQSDTHPPQQDSQPSSINNAGQSNEAQSQTDAQSLLATFSAALAAGTIAFTAEQKTVDVVRMLAQGVRGSGKFVDTLFHVAQLTPSRQAAALSRIIYRRGELVIANDALSPPEQKSRASEKLAIFAGGLLKVAVPRDFDAKTTDNGDVLLHINQSTLIVHLEQIAPPGHDAWSEIRRISSEKNSNLNMSGKKAYILTPDGRFPKSAIVGFGTVIVTLRIDASPGSPGFTKIRFALPRIIESLALVKG